MADDGVVVIPAGSGRGGRRPGAGTRKTGAPKKEEQADHYTRLAKAKADHEEQKARLAELERMQLEGELLSASDVQKRWADVAARVKAKMLSVPGQVAPRLIGVSDLAEADAIVKAAIYEALVDLKAK
jgi:phage terminase Nu1 subunit (DNA packaging protein)